MAKNRVVQHNCRNRLFYNLSDTGSNNNIQPGCNSPDSFVFSDYSFAGFGGNIEISILQAVQVSRFR